MKRIILLVLALIMQKANAGYGGRYSKPMYINKAEEKIIIFHKDWEEAIKLPEEVPSYFEVVSFDKLNFGRKIQHAYSSFMLGSNEYYELIKDKDSKKFDESYRKKSEADFKELIEFYKKRDFEKIEFIPLKRNEKLSHSNEGKAYKYYEIYDWPDSNLKLGWKMKIENGDTREPFKIFGLKDGKEIEFYQNQREPEWTYGGGRGFSFYTDSKKSFLLAMFSDTWGGTYYLKTQDFPAVFK